MINLNNEITQVMNLVKNSGYEIYLVGGFVRDSLLGKESYDVDMTTSATPDVLKNIFKEYKLNEEFANFGSVKFKVNNYNFEITTFRKEYNYSNHRKPSKVEFTVSLKEDLIRRDFTINALCYDGQNIVDLFNGINDLNNKMINTIGKAKVRFEEDSLRILRALRFSSKLGFVISEDIKQSIKETYVYLKEINYETLYRELKGILKGHNYLNVLNEYKNELIYIYDLKDLKINLFKKEMSEEEVEALFFYYSDINFNNKYLENKQLIFNEDIIDLKYKLKEYGYVKIYNTIYFRNKYLDEDKSVFKLLKTIEDNKECYNLKTLNIDGNDLLKLNIKNDKIGKCLNELLNAVIENKCKNDKNELIKYLVNNIID